jgi:YbbR domain-containing protein
MSRLGLKVSCLFVAIVIWMQVASTATVEQVASLPLRVTGLAAGCTVAGNELPREVAVRLRGSKLRLLAHRYLHRRVGEVLVDLAQQTPGRTFTYMIERTNVVTDLGVAGIVEPDRLMIRIDGQVTRRLPITLSTAGSLAPGCGYLKRPTAEPDSVTVSGPARYFPDQPVIFTAPLDLARLEGMGALTLRLLPPDAHLQLSAREVTVTYGVGMLAERTLADVPVVVLKGVGEAEVGVSPARADVLVRGVADSLRVFEGVRLKLTVQTSGLASGVHLLPAQVEAPDWVTIIGVDPVQFQVIVDTQADAPVARGGVGG